MTTPVSSEARSLPVPPGTPLWFPVLVFLGVAMVLFVTVQVSHDHLSPEQPPSPGELSTLGPLVLGMDGVRHRLVRVPRRARLRRATRAVVRRRPTVGDCVLPRLSVDGARGRPPHRSRLRRRGDAHHVLVRSRASCCCSGTGAAIGCRARHGERRSCCCSCTPTRGFSTAAATATRSSLPSPSARSSCSSATILCCRPRRLRRARGATDRERRY